jgi:hypothetical protein
VRKLLTFLIALALTIGAAASSFAQVGGLSFPGPGPRSSGAAAPTWTGTGSGVNAACGFVTTCNVTGVVANAGFNVISVYADMGGSAVDITGLSVCGTSFTRACTHKTG